MKTRDEWLAERRAGIGGSDAAAILGISPWRTAVDIWLDKTGQAAEKPETEAMRIGTELEDFVARRYCENTGRSVQRYNRMLHKGCLLGNFDRLVVMPGEKIAALKGEIRTDTLLECKTSSRDWDGEVPLYYQTQVQHYMGLAPELVHADVAVLFLNRKHFDIFRIERDDEIIAAMSAKLTAWWDKYIVGNEMPPPSNEDDCRKLYARSNPGKTITATAETLETIEAYRLEKRNEEDAKESAASLRSEICAAMGDAEILTDATGKPLITWKSGKDTRKTDWEAIAIELNGGAAIPAETIARHSTITIGARRFIVKA